MKLKDLKEKWQGKYFKTIAFFVFYFFFFTFVLIFYPNRSDTVKTEVKQVNILASIYNNYEYSYSVSKEENIIVNLSGKKYNNKSLFTINKPGEKVVEIYQFYNQKSIKIDNIWNKVSSYVLVDNSFNENLLDINRLKIMISDAELISTVNNFDGTKSENYTYDNLNIEVISENNILKKIIIKNNIYNIVLQYKNINKVKDFVVEK